VLLLALSLRRRGATQPRRPRASGRGSGACQGARRGGLPLTRDRHGALCGFRRRCRRRRARLLLKPGGRGGRDPRLAEADAAPETTGRGLRFGPVRGEQRADVDERGADGRGNLHGRVRGRRGRSREDERVQPRDQGEEVHKQCLGAGERFR